MKSFHYDRILENIRTLDDLQFFSSQIDMLVVNLYQTNTVFKQILETKMQRNFGNLIGEALTQQNVAYDNHEDLQAFFTGLQASLKHLPVLQLTIAYYPTNEQIEILSDTARKHTGKPVILNLHYDKRILGGAIVTYGGKYVDLTLKKRLDTVYESKKPEILKLLGEPSQTTTQVHQRTANTPTPSHPSTTSVATNTNFHNS